MRAVPRTPSYGVYKDSASETSGWRLRTQAWAHQQPHWGLRTFALILTFAQASLDGPVIIANFITIVRKSLLTAPLSYPASYLVFPQKFSL